MPEPRFSLCFGSRICSAQGQSITAHSKRISEFGYKHHYRGVFPIKATTARSRREIVDAGEQFHFGLEAGSKPELVPALAMQKGPESLIICNGYKDPAFIRIALLGRKLGKPVVIVAEKLEEVEQIIRASKEVGVEPWIGVRARLHSKGSGKWSPSGGENAKFGLDTTNLVAASQMLKDAGVAHCLKLVHFHVGSQVPDISTIKRAVREGARYYAKLSKLGHELGYLDVGGGLGVDYDGSRSDFDSSTNYSLQEYANDVVWNIIDVATPKASRIGDCVIERARDCRDLRAGVEALVRSKRQHQSSRSKLAKRTTSLWLTSSTLSSD